MVKETIIFALTSSVDLASKIAEDLELPLGKIKVDHFADGEILVTPQETVRGRSVFLVQSTCTPVTERLMEVLVCIDALKRASAAEINVITPYFGYARQDRKADAHQPITAKLVANLLQTAGASRVLTIDIHAPQIQGFFDVPVDNCYSSKLFVEDMKSLELKNPCIVSPDMGGVVRARAISKLLNDADIAIIDKRRPRPNVSEVMNLIGEVKDRECIIVDDMIDTGGTLCKAAAALKARGAKKVIAYGTHPVLSGSAYENIKNSVIDTIVVTNSIPATEQFKATGKFRYVSLAPTLAEAIRRINNDESISVMFNDAV